MMSPDEVVSLKRSMSFWLCRWRRYPLAYVIECIGDVPTHQQAQVLKAFEHHRFVAVKSGHGIGKSKLIGWLSNWWLDTHGKRAPITGAGGDQLKDIVWPEVKVVCNTKPKWLGSRYVSVEGELKSTEYPEICRAILRTTRQDNDDALQGFHDCMFFIDEASGVRDGVFEVASGALGDPGCYGFMTGNPTRTSGYFHDVFTNPTFWYTMSFSSEDTMAEETYSWFYVDPSGQLRKMTCHGRQTRRWIEDMRNSYGISSNVYRYRVLGEFANMRRDSVIEPQFIDRVRSSALSPKAGVRRMGVDPAWMGDDDTGVVIREGTRIIHAEKWHGFDLVESFNRCRVLFADWECDYVHVDPIGVGAGLYDMFRHAVYRNGIGYPVISVMASAAPPNDGTALCRTLRDWLWWRSREFFRSKNVEQSVKAEAWGDLVSELTAPGYKIVSGKIVAESKDDLKKRGIRSPNMADALNLTFYGDHETFHVKYMTTSEYRSTMHKKKQPVRSWKTR